VVIASSRKSSLIGFAETSRLKGGGITSKVEGATDAHCWLLLELPQALGGPFVHHQVQGLV
jgi:hypothetical protein